MCIPLRNTSEDDWTELLITSFKCKDKFTEEGLLTRRYVTSAWRALENYMSKSGECNAQDVYDTASVIVPRLVEILLNFMLTFWFKVDAFSSALVARRAVKQYIVDDNGRGFAASVFMTETRVKSNVNHSNVCQVLYFRGNLPTFRTLAVIVACVNLSCFISWAMLVGSEGSINKWYHTHSMPPSKFRAIVMLGAIVISLCMDGIDLLSCLKEALLPPSLLEQRLELERQELERQRQELERQRQWLEWQRQGLEWQGQELEERFRQWRREREREREPPLPQLLEWRREQEREPPSSPQLLEWLRKLAQLEWLRKQEQLEQDLQQQQQDLEQLLQI